MRSTFIPLHSTAALRFSSSTQADMKKHVERLSLALKDQYQRQHLKRTTDQEQKKKKKKRKKEPYLEKKKKTRCGKVKHSGKKKQETKQQQQKADCTISYQKYF